MIRFEVTLPQAFVLVTKNTPLVITVIEEAVEPLLNIPPAFPDKVTLPPAQKVVGPLAVITEAAGGRAIVTILLAKEIAPVRESALP